MSDYSIVVERLVKYYRRWGRYRWQSFKGALLSGQLRGTFQPSEHLLALDDVSITVQKGEMVGVIGRNGSGKSTLLKVVAGILTPNSGSAAAQGRIAALIELGAGFHPEISGRDNVLINGVMLGLSRKEIRKRMDDIVRFAELEAFMEEPVKAYSSGMYVRLGFSVAVHVDADILLVDEVLAVGDEAFSRKCIERILSLQARGVTILFVSHDLDLITKLCQRVVWLDKGKIMKIGSPHDVVRAYREAVGKSTDSSEDLRNGTGEASLTQISLIGEEGRESSLLPSNRKEFTIRLYAQAHRSLDDVVFGIAIRRREGEIVYGTNTLIDGIQFLPWEGEGCVEFKVEGAALTPGNYFLDAAIHRKDGRAYDYWMRCLEFTVHGEKRDLGGFRPAHRWTFAGEIDVDPADGAG
ncbi:MAG TPA: ABC transporter ATP-binding protein [Thermoanaerobaculia bacterium]|nr:ABC transporter ATP-binding protein [Thermoanaerobaculia bacterium]HUM29471.1 ABC transporter ATP-binding protein [Thermoanaerobaculia bacterium]HXK67854.1 ABC transporter ATP-binding protein [Thermoanaerobaculia bacterium]